MEERRQCNKSLRGYGLEITCAGTRFFHKIFGWGTCFGGDFWSPVRYRVRWRDLRREQSQMRGRVEKLCAIQSTSKNFFFRMAILNISINLHAFSVEGWLPSPPCVVTMSLTAYPTSEEGYDHIFFFLHRMWGMIS